MTDRGPGNDRAIAAKSYYGMGMEPTYAGALSFMRRNYSRDLTGVDAGHQVGDLAVAQLDARDALAVGEISGGGINDDANGPRCGG